MLAILCQLQITSNNKIKFIMTGAKILITKKNTQINSAKFELFNSLCKLHWSIQYIIKPEI